MKIKLFFISIFLFFFLFSSTTLAAPLKPTFPRLANYYLKWELNEKEARELAKWDVLILDMETQENSPESLRLIRRLNPDVVILAYITSQEIIDDVERTAGYTGARLRQKLRDSISPEWWLKDASGNKIMNWPGTYMLNLSDIAPKNSASQRFHEFLPDFVFQNIVSSGMFDGIFYDNTWGDVTWVNPNLDLNCDGQSESCTDADRAWARGFKKMLEKSRSLFGNDFIIVGNGNVYFDYQGLLNGMMLESFPSPWENGGKWSGSMETYFKLDEVNLKPALNIINVNKKNELDYKSMRFGLGSALLGNGFYSFDYDVTNHTQTWWYDEYSVNLGPATSLPYNLLKPNDNKIQAGLWRRDFKQGSVILNSTDKSQLHIFKKEELEKIRGTQDKSINNGDRINHLNLASRDAVLLLKSADNIYNTPFVNGYFYRVFGDNGEQSRNGFFAYSPNFPASSSVAIADGSRRDREDVSVLADKGKIVLNKNGAEIVSFYPYQKLYRGDLNIATHLNDGFFEIVATAPSRGGGPQVRVFTATGNLISSFFAYDKSLRGGLSVALADVDGDGKLDIITGAGYGDKPVVKIFSLDGKLKHSFLAYHENFRGGVEVASGDVNANGKNEIVVAPGPGGGPHVRIFNSSGNLLGQFFAYDDNVRSGLKLSLDDVNSDGKMEILLGIKDLFY